MLPDSESVPPPGIKVKRTIEGLVLSKSWFHYSHFPTFALAVAWNGFVIYWFLKYVAPTKSGAHLVDLIPFTIGLALAYFALAKAINSTIITISNRSIKVSAKPMPWLGGKEVLRPRINKITTSYDVSVSNPLIQTSSVYIEELGGRKYCIIKELESSKQADFIQQIIKTNLHLPF
jgi:hypothetical protein